MTKVRINKYDNLKGMAILIVLIMHFDFIHALPGEFIHYLYLPFGVFFFVSGYFSKIDSTQPQKSFKRLIVPYLIFCVLLELFKFAYLGSMNWKMIIIHSGMALWFLVALFIMKMILPIVDKFRYPILTTLAFALLFGLYDINPYLLGLTRAFAYLPIFLLGFYYNSYIVKNQTFNKDEIHNNYYVWNS